MASEDEEVSALDRVLTRTVLTKDDDLQQLLAKLLPALVQKLATAQPKTRAKVLELLSHINKRVRALPGCSLPLLPLLQLAVGSSSSSASSPMVASFGLVYVEMGQPRAPAEEQLHAVPLLLTGISRRAQQHRAVALRVATAALSLLQQAPGGNFSQVIAVTDKTSSSSSSSSSKPVAAVSLLPPAPEDRAVLLQHALKLMLYQRPSSGSRAAPTPLGLANAAAAAASGAPAAAQAAAAALPPPGLSAADVLLLEEKGVPSQDQLVALKLGLLALLGGAAAGMPGNAAAAAAAAAVVNAAGSGSAAAGGKAGVSEGSAGAAMDVDSNAGDAAATATAAVAAVTAAAAAQPAAVYLSSEELLLVLLAASCDPYEAVARRGADLLQKLVNPDAARPAVDLESQALVGGLTALLLGDQDPGAPQPAAAPAGPALAVRIMQLLVRSVAAAQAFPAAPLVLSACMYGPASSPRLLRLGAEWAGWMFKHAPAHQLRAMAGPLLQRLLAALGLEGAEGGDAMQVDGAPAAGGAAVAGLAGSAEARGHVFSALAQLSQRLPDLFQSDTALASRLFAALGAEPPGSRTALQEALGGLAAAMGQGIQGAAGAAAAGAAAGAAGSGAGGGALPPSKVEELEGLLLSSIGSEQAAVRLCAAQWAAKLFPRSHMPSRYVCLLAAGDAKPEVREAGLTGLGLSATQLPADAAAAPSAYAAAVAGLGLPLPGAVVAYLVTQHRQLAQPGDLSRPLPLPDASCKALAAFLRAAATAAAHGSSSSSSSGPDAPWAAGYSLSGHVLLLENLACRAAGRDTVCAALEGLVELLGGTAPWLLAGGGSSSSAWQAQVAELRERAAARQAWLSHWLAHHHQPVRLAAARLTALAAAAAQPAAAEALLQQLLAALPPVGSASGSSGGSSRLEEQEGSLLAAGLILARSASCSSPALPAELQQSALAALTQQLRHHSGSTAGAGGGSNGNAAGSAGGRSLVLAGAAALALGFVSLAGQAALPGLLTDGSSSSGGDAAPAAAAAASGSDSVALAAAAAAIGGAGSAASSGSVAPGSVLGVLLSLAGNGKDSRAALRAVAAVGYIAAGNNDQQVHLAAAKGLLALSSTKGLSEELLLGLGEAAAAAAGDVSGFDPALLLWSNLDSVADCVDAAEAAAAGASAAAGTALHGQQADEQQAAAMDVDTAAANGSGSSSSSSRGGVQEYLLAELGKMAVAPKEEVRCAACLLLVSLLQLCKGSGLLAGRLPQLQATFTGLLGDSNELTQDLAARGVSLVYSRGGAPLQQQLLGQLLGLLQGGPGAPAAAAAGAAGVKLAGDSKLFEEGQLGATPGGGGLTTYRELCSLANDLGQPDLVYRFMDLARASSALSAKRGAAVGVARIARLAAAATPGGTGQPGGGSGLASLLGPQRLASLLPKLYRLCHDPSPKVCDSMSAIWAALLDDPRAAVDAHYDDIMKSLLADVGARLWRVRQAACASLTDLLAGRRWHQLAPHMEQLWVMGLRAADDVKESVRGAAGGLVRSLRGLSLRLMDAQQSPAADVAGCCSVVLPLLAGSQGLGSSVPELRGVAADVLCSGIKSAGSAQVLPVLPSVVPVLLEALSGMEDARLNYVEQHAESIGLDADQLAAARLAAARSSSITEALDAASRALTGPAAVEMVPALADLVRRGVGLSSKVGAASFMRGLATRLGQELKPAAPTLLKPLVAGVARESSAPVKRAYAAAAAAVAARCCGDKRRDKFVSDAVASYGAVEVQLQPWRPGGDAVAAAAAAPMAVDEPSGGGEDAARQAGGLLLRELLKESSDTFNAYAAQVLPVAFVASHDEVTSVASAWAAVWSQGCPSEPAALRLHAAELAGLLAGGLGSSAWPRKRAAAKALSALAEVAPDQLGPYSPALAQLLLAEASGGRLWEGKEGLMACLGGLGAACAVTLAQQPGVDVLLGGLLSAAARKKTSYRAAALAAMQKVLVALLPLTRTTTVPAVVDGGAVWGTVSPPLLDALQQNLAAASAPAPAAKAEAAAGAAEPADEAKPLPLPETCSCLGAAWKLTPGAARAAAAPLLVKLLSGLMAAAGLSWTNWLAVVTLAQAVIEAAAPPGASTAAGGGSVPAAACVLLAGGLVHVIQHSTISQLRGKCLEVLVQLLQKFEGDAEASRAFLSADADASSISGAGGESAATGAGAGCSSLSSTVARCMATVASQDPSAAHTALAGRATAVLQRLNNT